jgi:transcriptional regulator with XRE-family HTH domain
VSEIKGDRSPSDQQVSPRLVFERDLLFGEAIETVAALLASNEISQRELAERLKRSEPRVSLLLKGGENVTLKTIADLGYALGIRFALVPIPFEDRDGTPAEEDPDPPAWIDRQRRQTLSRAKASTS